MPSFVKPAPFDDVALLQHLVNHTVYAAALRPHIREIKRHYRWYTKEFMRPIRLYRRKVGLGNAGLSLSTLYGKPRQYLSYQDDIRRASRIGACPYCGIPSPSTIDHYLPRDNSFFPQLALLSVNLVPSCSDCQPRKGSWFPQKQYLQDRSSRFARSRPHQRFIHPYFDKFAADQLLHVQFDPAPKYPDFRLRIRRSLSRDKRALLTFHVAKLDVHRKMQDFCAREWDAVKEHFADHPAQDRGAVVAWVREKLRFAIRRTRLANASEVVFYRSIASAEHVLQHLLSIKARPGPMLEEFSRARHVA